MSEAEAVQQSPERTTWGGVLLAVAGLVWAAAMLLSARVSITSTSQAELEVVTTSYAMPGVVSASLVAGMAVASAVLAFVTRRRQLGATVRFAVSTGAGLVIGLLGALTIITINTDGWIYAVMGGTIAAAATIGGALAGFRLPRVVTAAAWAAIVVFLVGVVLAFLQDDLLPVFGAGDTSASRADAANYWGYAQGILSGLASGVVTFLVLRRIRKRTGSDVRWPLYALAAAGPGLLLIVAEILTHTLGSRLLSLAAKVSAADSSIQSVLSAARINNALMVLFVGAFAAIVAVGRTLQAPPDEAPSEEAAVAGRRNARSRAAAGTRQAAAGTGRAAAGTGGAAAGTGGAAASSDKAGTPAAERLSERPADPEEIERAARAEDDDPESADPSEPTATAPGKPTAAASSAPTTTVPGKPTAAAPGAPTTTVPGKPTAAASGTPTTTTPGKSGAAASGAPTATAPGESGVTAPGEPTATASGKPTAAAPAGASAAAGTKDD
ncbi:DUF2339 domain-containing protein [Actinoplanes sp. RD1]|uniref:hypothetical protein n=1 Tax=Actinoplanes sp. RD1 TaxID=3064538 RepID=UPI0027407E5D|nr:hypothetical protein [Actinoplanes sp. RD1]